MPNHTPGQREQSTDGYLMASYGPQEAQDIVDQWNSGMLNAFDSVRVTRILVEKLEQQLEFRRMDDAYRTTK